MENLRKWINVKFVNYVSKPSFTSQKTFSENFAAINEIKVIGKMKDEFGGSIITKFIGLKSKMYFVGTEDGKIVKKGKRINKMLLKKYMMKYMKIFCLIVK